MPVDTQSQAPIEAPMLSKCFADPYDLLSLSLMAGHSSLVSGLLSSIINHQNEKQKDIKKPAFDMQLWEALMRGEGRNEYVIKSDILPLEAMRLYGSSLASPTALSRACFLKLWFVCSHSLIVLKTSTKRSSPAI